MIKDIPGFEGRYGIDENGTITSLITKRKITPMIGTTGYYMVNLRKNNKQHMRRVHRLIALAFIPPVEGKNNINHKDGNKLNNTISNLEWCTQSENIKHSYDVLKRCLPDGPRNAKSKLILDLVTGVYFDSIKFAAIAHCTTRGILKWHLRTNGRWRNLIYA